MMSLARVTPLLRVQIGHGDSLRETVQGDIMGTYAQKSRPGERGHVCQLEITLLSGGRPVPVNALVGLR